MRYASFLIPLLALPAMLLLGACASRDEAATPIEENMQVSVDFREIHRCSRISPQITVAYAPKGTKFFDVRLVELGDSERFLGGGQWNLDETGIIPEGALTRHYTGPCPPKDKVTEYAYIVSAMESENGQPLAVRVNRFDPNN